MSPAPQIAQFNASDLPPVPDPLAPVAEETTAPTGMLAKLAAERQRMLSETIELALEVPTWQGKLVAVLTPLTRTEAEALVARGKRRSDVSLDMQNNLAACDAIATACRRLLYDGEQVPGAVTVSGFTAEFGSILEGVKPDATAADIVFVAFGKDPALLGPFVTKFRQWSEDPRPAGVVDGPFAGI